ncbi:MAG: BatD family protein, partial [Verrucomicrobiota bacterium]|nr:BatD family protein [Verrucomicrobiota bacterium]
MLSLAVAARAADAPNVTAVLTDSETTVGRPVQLQIQVRGASNPTPPGEITVDGLDIRSAGVSRQYQMNNFSVSYSFTYNYTVMPLKPGAFKIPPLTVQAGGKSFRTPELTLNVTNASAQTGRSGRGNNARDSVNVDPAQIGFIEMALPKTTAYVGEMIPVQVRLGLNMRAPVESLGSGVQIAGQGFTTQKLTEPRQTVETINGRSYQVFIFKTAIAAARTGKLEIGPAEIDPVVRVARAGRGNPSLPRDILDDPFFNNFFNDPAFAPSMPKEIHLKSEPATLEVKPLPPNAPPGFAGAIGTFIMKVDANPKKAQVGDPVTVTATITGRGNFDRATAPALENENGWHKYPPSDNFKQDDDVGISGAKTFEMVLSAKERKEKLPPVTFTYFDPVREQYVTLRSDEIPLHIEGGAAPTASPATASLAPSASRPPVAVGTPAPAKQEQDILYQITDRPRQVESFTPLYRRRAFWMAQLLPLAALIGCAGLKLRARRRDDRAAQRLARLHAEAAELQRALRQKDVTAQQYAAKASRAVQLKAALASDLDPNQIDAESAVAA